MDWKKLLNELRESGMSQAEIARELGRSQAWVSAVCAGDFRDLKWADGQRILDMLRVKCNNGAIQGPRSGPAGMEGSTP